MKKIFLIGLLLSISTSVFAAQTYSGPFKADGSNLPPGAVTQNYFRVSTLNSQLNGQRIALTNGLSAVTGNFSGLLSGQRVTLTDGINAVTGNFSGNLVGTTQTLTGQLTGQRISISNGISAVTGNFTGDVAFDTNVLYVDAANDRVGVGTNTPSQKLHVAGNIRTDAGGFVYTDNFIGINSTLAIGSGSVGDAITFSQGASERMRITGGSLGIGTTNPSTTLHVNGNATMTGAAFGYTTTATAADTTTLTSSSTYYQDFTGSTTQTCTLPVASTLSTGWTFNIRNHSSGTVTVQSSGGNTIASLTANTTVTVICISTSGTGTSSWSWVTANIGG